MVKAITMSNPGTRLDPAAAPETRAGRTLYESTARQSSVKVR